MWSIPLKLLIKGVELPDILYCQQIVTENREDRSYEWNGKKFFCFDSKGKSFQATFTVPGEFEVKVTILGEIEKLKWTLLHVKILVEDYEVTDISTLNASKKKFGWKW